jgi:hypothetical protein
MLKKLFLGSLILTNYLSANGYSMFENGSFGLNVNKDDVEIEGRASVSFITGTPVYNNFFLNGNYLNANNKVLGFGLSVENSPINYQNIVFNIGLRSVFSDHNSEDFVALPITVGAKARLFLGTLPITYLGTKFAYAPNPLSFKEADEYKEYRIELDSSIIQNVNVYFGYRNIDTHYDSGKSSSIDDSLYGGFKFVF